MFLYFIIRFWILHSNWRYHNSMVYVAFSTIIPVYCFSQLGHALAFDFAFYLSFPAMTAISVMLHYLLGKRAWKNFTVEVELR